MVLPFVIRWYNRNRTTKCPKRLQKQSVDDNLRQLVLIRQDRVLKHLLLYKWFWIFFPIQKKGRLGDGKQNILWGWPYYLYRQESWFLQRYLLFSYYVSGSCFMFLVWWGNREKNWETHNWESSRKYVHLKARDLKHITQFRHRPSCNVHLHEKMSKLQNRT